MLVIRVCMYHDFAKRATVYLILDCVKHSNVHVYYSGPCTGGLPFNIGLNQALGEATRLKISGHWKLHDQLWIVVKRIAARCKEVNATMSIEWSHRCAYHRLKSVQKRVNEHEMIYRIIPGCCFNLKSIEKHTFGQFLCKACGMWLLILNLLKHLKT